MRGSGPGATIPATTSLDSASLLAYQCPAAAPMEAARIYFIVFGALTIVGGIVGYLKAGSVASIIAGSITGVLLLVAAYCAYCLAFARCAICSEISGDRKSHARGDDVDPKRDWNHCGHRRLGKKVIAWEEFAFGRGGGLC